MEQQQRRSHRLRLALLSSVGSKVLTALVALGALPFGRKALGQDEFALYAAMVASVAWMRTLTIGLSPALTVRISEASTRNDETGERKIFVSGLLPLFAICALLLTLGLGIAAFAPLHLLLGDKIHFDPMTARIGLSLMTLLLALELGFGGFEAVQAGYQEVHRNNIRQIIGNSGCFLAIIIVAKVYPTSVGLLLAAYGPLILAQTYNVWQLLKQRPYLRLAREDFDRSEFSILLRDGAAYAVSGSLASFLVYQLPVNLSARVLNPVDTGNLSFAMTLVTQLAGMVAMITVPLRPAMAEARATGDTHWIRRIFMRTQLFTILYGICVGLGMVVLGQWGFTHVFKSPVLLPSAFFVAWGVHFVLVSWEGLAFSVLYALGNQVRAASIWLVRSLVAAAALIWSRHVGRIAGVFICLALSIAVLSVVPYAILIRTKIYRENHPQTKGVPV